MGNAALGFSSFTPPLAGLLSVFYGGQRNDAPVLPEYVSLGAGVTLFILFSASRFQLPHYLNIVFPFYAALAAHYVTTLTAKGLRNWTIAQTIMGGLVLTFVTGIFVLYHPDRFLSGLIWIGLLTLGTLIAFWRSNNVNDVADKISASLTLLMGRMVGLMVLIGGLINLFFYPSVMRYQAGMVAAEYTNARPALQGTNVSVRPPDLRRKFVDLRILYAAPGAVRLQDSTLRRLAKTAPVQVLTTAIYADSLTQRGFPSNI